MIGYLDRATRGPSATFVRAAANEVSVAIHRGRPTLDTLIAGDVKTAHPMRRGDQLIDNVDTTVKATRLLKTTMRQRAPAGDDMRE